MLDYARTVSFAEENQKLSTSLTVVEGATVAISTLPTIHATRIDVMLEAATNDVEVTLRIYAGSKTIQADKVLGTVVAGTTARFSYGHQLSGANAEVIGQVADIVVENTDGQASGAAAVYSVWAAARS